MPSAVILCLANSKKMSGRCVAGLRIDGSGWLRPVSRKAFGVLNVAHYFLNVGRDAALLDVIEVGLKRPKPEAHQPENWLLDDDRVWKLLDAPKLGECASVLRSAVAPGPELLRGTSDRVPFADFEKNHADASLALVAPDKIDLVLQKKPDGKKQVRGRFSLASGANASAYNLSMTEPYWEKAVLANGNFSLKQTERKFVVTISLSEPYNGICYKLIAAVIPLPAELAAAF